MDRAKILRVTRSLVFNLALEGSSDRFAVPCGTTPGIYYLGAIADVNGAVTEGNEGNNTILATGTITVTP
jgi:hypothetical protein